MSAQKRRFLEGGTGTPTFIGAESVFVGNIRGAGHFVVSGEVHGDGELHGGLNLSATGSWHGFIQAEQAIVAGKITGGLSVKDKLEIGYTADPRGGADLQFILDAEAAGDLAGDDRLLGLDEAMPGSGGGQVQAAVQFAVA